MNIICSLIFQHKEVGPYAELVKRQELTGYGIVSLVSDVKGVTVSTLAAPKAKWRIG